MDIRENLLENKHFLLQALAGLIEIERERILKSGLATEAQLNALTDSMEYLTKLGKKYPKSNVVLNTMANLCTELKSIQLPGDFEKRAAEEKFYIALDLPYEGEQFYDLSSILKDKKLKEEIEEELEEVEKEECVECEKEKKEEEEIEREAAQKILADAVNKHLISIAHILGNKGEHEAAFLVERTAQKIQTAAERNELFKTNRRK